MTSLSDIKTKLFENKNRLVNKYGLSFIAVFGSYSRGQQSELSDIYILVDFSKPIGIEFIDLAEELEDILNHKVDLVSKRGVKEIYFQQIEKELCYV